MSVMYSLSLSRKPRFVLIPWSESNSLPNGTAPTSGSASCSSTFNRRRRRSITYHLTPRLGIRSILVLVLFCFISVTEGKVQLIPKPRKAVLATADSSTASVNHGPESQPSAPFSQSVSNVILDTPKETLPMNTEESSPMQMTHANQVITVPLQATLVMNEDGKQVLQLSVKSANALPTVLDPPRSNTLPETVSLGHTSPGEVPPPQTSKMLESEFEASPRKSGEGDVKNSSAGRQSPLHSESSPPLSATRNMSQFVSQASQSKDQLIIFSTVATMALLVGALSARRMRSRQLLNFCIENETLEEDLAYDAAYTTQSTVGAASTLYGGYDTFSTMGSDYHMNSRFGSDLRWRGDLEKFDV